MNPHQEREYRAAREQQAKWDGRFLELARLVASWSKDPSTQIGAVIVRPDKTVASVGFNGLPRGVRDLPERYADRDWKLATVVHAEENAILSSRDPSLEGCTVYVSGLPPCAACAAKLIQAGVRRVVAASGEVPERWRDNMRIAASLLAEARVCLEVSPPGQNAG